MGKRAFDWLLSSVALLLLWPLLGLIALAVKLDSRGPVLFRQQRVGLHGKLFHIHKFRSMAWQPAPVNSAVAAGASESASSAVQVVPLGSHESCASLASHGSLERDSQALEPAQTSAEGPQVTAGNDARITRVGRFLRRSKLDELPQLWDVWRGAMSVVGPRPEVPRFMNQYAPEVRARIVSVRPGITDWAAVLFRDEESLLARAGDPEQAYVQTIMPIKQAHYLRYVAAHSFWGDVRIVWATVCVVLGWPVKVPVEMVAGAEAPQAAESKQ